MHMLMSSSFLRSYRLTHNPSFQRTPIGAAEFRRWASSARRRFFPHAIQRLDLLGSWAPALGKLPLQRVHEAEFPVRQLFAALLAVFQQGHVLVSPCSHRRLSIGGTSTRSRRRAARGCQCLCRSAAACTAAPSQPRRRSRRCLAVHRRPWLRPPAAQLTVRADPQQRAAVWCYSWSSSRCCGPLNLALAGKSMSPCTAVSPAPTFASSN